MASSSIKNGSSTTERGRLFAFVCGASSAFDLTGLRILDADLIGVEWVHPPPSHLVARDFGRALSSVARQAERGARVIDAGDDLEVLPTDRIEAERTAPRRSNGRSSD